MKPITFDHICNFVFFRLVGAVMLIWSALLTWHLYAHASTIVALSFLIFASLLFYLYIKTVML